METIDIAIILLVLWSVYHGWKQGLFKEIISMIGFFVGLFVAFRLYSSFGSYLAPSLSSNAVIANYLGKAVAFILIWIVVPILLGVVANILTRSLQGLHLGKLNSLGGAAVSLLKYLVLMSFVFCAMDYVGILNKEKKANAQLYQPVASIVKNFFVGKEKPVPASDDETETASDTVWIDVHPQKK